MCKENKIIRIHELQKYMKIDRKKTGQDLLLLDVEDLVPSNNFINGSWDLYDDFSFKEELEDEIYLMNEGKIYVGTKRFYKEKYAIDFGTKSTVVGRIEHIHGIDLLKVIKLGKNYSTIDEIDDSVYENPSILYFVDYDKFMEEYKSMDWNNIAERRPKTNINDIQYSHYAKNILESETKMGISSISYFKDIKKWTTLIDREFYFKSNSNNDIEKIIKLKTFDNIKINEDFNPITLYFYLVGSVLHNNKTKTLASEYIMSYPTSTKKKIRKKTFEMVKSGLFKTYPKSFDFEKNKPGIKLETNEPTAYAIAAFDFTNAYKDKTMFFSVFDFGGGTSDYTYGIYDEVDEIKVIQNIFNYGDKRLGGENLIEELAYELVLTGKNPVVLMEGNYRVNKMLNRNNQLLDDITDTSKYALANEYKLKEILRPIWEKYLDICKFMNNLEGENNFNIDIKGIDYRQVITEKKLEIDFINSEGQPGVIVLEFEINNLLDILNKKIRRGVRNFIQGLKTSISRFNDKEIFKKIVSQSRAIGSERADDFIENLYELNFDDLDKVIILGGNSSKSPLFKEILDEELNKAGLEGFKVYDPLDVYNEILEKLSIKNGVEITSEKLETIKEKLYKKYKKDFVDVLVKYDLDYTQIPNSKTGVVYGLCKLSDKENCKYYSKSQNEEIPFLYNIIGFRYDSKLNCNTEYVIEKVDKDEKIKVSKWIKYKQILQRESVTDIRYTDIQYDGKKPKDLEKDFIDMKIISVRLDLDDSYFLEDEEDKEVNLYIRLIDADTIEYTVSMETPDDSLDICENNIVRLGIDS